MGYCCRVKIDAPVSQPTNPHKNMTVVVDAEAEDEETNCIELYCIEYKSGFEIILRLKIFVFRFPVNKCNLRVNSFASKDLFEILLGFVVL